MNHRAAWLAVFALIATLSAARAEPPIASLGLGESAFWEGLDRDLAGELRRYDLVVEEAGTQLRVALDRRDFGVGLSLRSPAGVVTHAAGGWYGLEAFVDDPAPGVWTVEVSQRRDAAPFRLRARLDGEPGSPGPAGDRLPNLRMVPPFEFTFDAPLPISGGELPNCSPQEIVETEARRCLRFSAGPANDGDGPLLVRFAPLEGVVTSGTAYQVVYDSSGATREREAGTFEYHKTHLHYHHSGFGRTELLRVLDPETGEMALAGTGPKQGFCTGDVLFFDWFGFTQPRSPVDSSCVDEAASTGTTRPLGTTMALNTGWADLYSWSQDGMYAEWGANADGTYVVRITADSRDWILETDEHDNSSYALIRIEGTSIDVLERGLGRDPWDPGKVLVADRLPGTA